MADAVESFIRSRAEGKHRDAVDSFLDELMAAPRDTVPGQGQPVPDISDPTDPTMQRFIENQDTVGGRVANVGMMWRGEVKGEGPMGRASGRERVGQDG